MKEILGIAKDQFYAMGVALQPTSYGIVKNSLRNLPDELIRVWLHADFGPSNPCQYFFAE